MLSLNFDTIIFTVNYTDVDNDNPEYVRLVFDLPGPSYSTIDMIQVGPNDTNYMDGAIFRCEVDNLIAGVYYYYFEAGDFLSSVIFYNNTENFKIIISENPLFFKTYLLMVIISILSSIGFISFMLYRAWGVGKKYDKY